VDFDVLLPAKLHDKVAPTIDPLLEDKQVGMLRAAAQHLGACSRKVSADVVMFAEVCQRRAR
jgi:hypothetical protein